MAWRKLAASGGVAAARADEAGRPIPHACFKVPTGGGKTLLAAAALERLNRPTGLTLWIVPSRAIYQQTCTVAPGVPADAGAGERRAPRCWKKTFRSPADVVNYLCVMLMLPAAKEFLRMSGLGTLSHALSRRTARRRAPVGALSRRADRRRAEASLFNVFKMLSARCGARRGAQGVRKGARGR